MLMQCCYSFEVNQLASSIQICVCSWSLPKHYRLNQIDCQTFCTWVWTDLKKSPKWLDFLILFMHNMASIACIQCAFFQIQNVPKLWQLGLYSRPYWGMLRCLLPQTTLVDVRKRVRDPRKGWGEQKKKREAEGEFVCFGIELQTINSDYVTDTLWIIDIIFGLNLSVTNSELFKNELSDISIDFKSLSLFVLFVSFACWCLFLLYYLCRARIYCINLKYSRIVVIIWELKECSAQNGVKYP